MLLTHEQALCLSSRSQHPTPPPPNPRVPPAEEIKECNMYKLGFCIYGPTCRYKHKPMPGEVMQVVLCRCSRPYACGSLCCLIKTMRPCVPSPALAARLLLVSLWSKQTTWAQGNPLLRM